MKPLTPSRRKPDGSLPPSSYQFTSPPVVSAAREQFGFNHPPPPAKPSAAVPYALPSEKPPEVAGLSPQMQATYLGRWEGSELLQNNDQCRVKLEIRLNPEKVGQVSAYETRNCYVISRPSTDKAPEPPIVQLMKDMNPVSTVMTSSANQGALTFHVDNTIGTSPDVCPMTSYTVSRFGDQSIVAQWKEGSCTTSAGQMVLTRNRG